jgi:hypothetical protein
MAPAASSRPAASTTVAPSGTRAASTLGSSSLAGPFQQVEQVAPGRRGGQSRAGIGVGGIGRRHQCPRCATGRASPRALLPGIGQIGRRLPERTASASLPTASVQSAASPGVQRVPRRAAERNVSAPPANTLISRRVTAQTWPCCDVALACA